MMYFYTYTHTFISGWSFFQHLGDTHEDFAAYQFGLPLALLLFSEHLVCARRHTQSLVAQLVTATVIGGISDSINEQAQREGQETLVKPRLTLLKTPLLITHGAQETLQICG